MDRWMTELFTGRGQNPRDAAARRRAGRRAGVLAMGVNLLLSAGKLTLGFLTGSVAMAADGVNNLSDGASGLMTYVGFRLSERPADARHPYGHARFEYLSGLGVAALILVMGAELLHASITAILDPRPVEMNLAAGIMLVGSIAVKHWLGLLQKALGETIGSKTLLASAADSRNDVLSTSAVLACALIEAGSHWHADGWVGLAVAVFILISAVRMGKETISPLLGESASPELRKKIVKIVEQEPLVLGYHDLMVHDYGPGQQFASIHVEMDGRRDPLECHEIIDEMERLCLERDQVHLVIHYDPVRVGDHRQDRIRGRVERILARIDGRLTLHDFRMAEEKSHISVEFDVILPWDMQGREQEIRREVESWLRDYGGGKPCYAVITFDPAQPDPPEDDDPADFESDL